MPNNKRVLIAVDGGGTSRRMVDYVAEVAGGNPGLHVGLLHLELPPRMIEWGGSEEGEVEDNVAAERAEAYRDLEVKTIQSGQTVLQKLQACLSEKRIDVTARMVQFEEPLDPKHITNHILKTAAEGGYGTVVVGWHAFSGLRRLLGHHVGGDLVHKARGIAVWVVK